MLKAFAKAVSEKVAEKLADADPLLLERLSQLILEAYPEAELSRCPEDILAERIIRSYLFIKRRKKGDVKLHLERLKEGPFLLLVNMEDQPFLVDTLQMQIENMGLTLRLCVHPILTVKRDGEGLLLSAEPRWKEGDRESLMFLEIPYISPEKEHEVKERLLSILLVVRDVVGDFLRIKRRLKEVINDVSFYMETGGDDREEISEVISLLEWLYKEHFVFLGLLYLKPDGSEESELGICRPRHRHFPGLIKLGGIKARLEKKRGILVVTKGENFSQVYRRGRLDLIAVRHLSENAKPLGWYLFFGLYSKLALTEKREFVPVVRLKLQHLLQNMKVVAGSHDYRRIVALFNLIPLEEVLISSERDVQRVLSAVIDLEREKSLELCWKRREEYLWVLVVLSYDKYSSRLEEEIKSHLSDTLRLKEVEERLAIFEERLALLWYFFYGDRLPSRLDEGRLEEDLLRLSQSWEDIFNATLVEAYPPAKAAILYRRYGGIFSEEYKAITPPEEAIVDLLYLEQLTETGEVQVSFHQEEGYTRMKFFSLKGLTLSFTVPMLENMGLEVLDEVSLHLGEGNNAFHIHSFRVVTSQKVPVFEEVWFDLSEALKAVMRGEIESDPMNRLVVREGLGWKVVDLFRAFRNYLRQIVPRFSPSSISDALLAHPRVARTIWDYFDAKFNPERGLDPQDRKEKALPPIGDSFEKAMKDVEGLTEDTVLRLLFNLVDSTVRTNFYRDRVSHYISLKIESSKVREMPLPRPMFEIYVHSKGMEGIHLRGGKIARGGIRWSDRPDDFRREILSLMKTQMVKNALIIPGGAKGGFVVKDLPEDREAVLEVARRQYEILIKGILDVTDNVVNGEVIHPHQVVCYDPEDPYLVVAADKGTAHLSDVANQLAREYGYWLEDAFASGGHTGYSHKGLGITAKGAWVCVKRHFMEMGIDPEGEVIKVVGIGDMGGDVFGNGMLLSRTIKLVGAFNHIHIFIDPDPDPEASWEERKRLFENGLGWDSYNKALISNGGGVYSRYAKAIPISPPAREMLSTDKAEVSGEELIQLLLKAPVDLLWNGGIGTYVKASSESHVEVGDPTNDRVRVDAKDLRVKVVGEGGNLGFTQKARVEYALHGGRINMDALDNSGGVDLSDHEVNIKILLQGPVKRNEIRRKERDHLLHEIAPQIVEAVLYDNYRQSLAVALDVLRSQRDLSPFQRLIEELIGGGFIHPDEVYLPSVEELRARANMGRGLFRPELVQLLGYEKLWVKGNLRDCAFIKAPYLREYLVKYFPQALQEKYLQEICQHLLRDEIVLTIMTNTIVNQAGLTFFSRMMSELEATPGEVAASYMIMEGVLDAPRFRRELYALDFKIPARALYETLLDIEETIEVLVRWSLFFSGDWLPLKEVIEKYRSQVMSLVDHITGVLPSSEVAVFESRKKRFLQEGFPEALAQYRATLSYMMDSVALLTLAECMGEDYLHLAPLYYSVNHLFKLDEVFKAIRAEEKRDAWEVMAYTYLERDLWSVKRELTRKVREYWEPEMDMVEVKDLLAQREPWVHERLVGLQNWIEEKGIKGLSAWSVCIRRFKESLGMEGELHI